MSLFLKSSHNKNSEITSTLWKIIANYQQIFSEWIALFEIIVNFGRGIRTRDERTIGTFIRYV